MEIKLGFGFLMLLAGCGGYTPVTRFVSHCGMKVQTALPRGVPNGWGGAAIDRLEQLAVDAKLVECWQLEGYSLRLTEGPFYTPGADYLCDAVTHCPSVDPFDVRIDARWDKPEVLIHEFHHVAQNCQAPAPTDPGLMPMHADWDRSGANARISSAQREYLNNPHEIPEYP